MKKLRALIFTALAAFTANAVSAELLAIKGATIYVSSDEPPIRKGVILVEDGKIAAVGARRDVSIPNDAETIDAKGFTVTAGFWNAHVHFFERKWAKAEEVPTDELNAQLQDMFTRYGFTSVFDLSSDLGNTFAIRDRIESGEVNGPYIRTTGEGLVAPGALPPASILAVMGVTPTPLPEVSDTDEAAMATQKLIAQNTDGVKFFVPSPRNTQLPPEVLEHIVARANDSSKPVFVHPNRGEDVSAALIAGADVIAHTTPHAGLWDEGVLDVMKQSPAALTPTLSLWEYYARHDRLSVQERIVSTAIEQLRLWTDANGIVLFGTDAGANQYKPDREYALMTEAGMTFADILASLTTDPANYLGKLEHTGKVEAGQPADLVILGGDPAENIQALSDIRYTIRAGTIIYRAPDQ